MKCRKSGYSDEWKKETGQWEYEITVGCNRTDSVRCGFYIQQSPAVSRSATTTTTGDEMNDCILEQFILHTPLSYETRGY